MSKQARDVTGGDAVLGSLIPGLGLVNYVLGWFTAPIEAFLRRDFGQRYFTTQNFYAGLMVLLGLQFIGYLIGLLNPLSIIGILFGRGGSSVSWLGTITKWYIWLGIFHFLRMSWNNIVGKPVHSFSAGRSWLRPVGQAVMFVLNLFLDAIVRLIFELNPKLDKRRLDIALPTISDADTFTEKYVEPAFVLFVAFIAAGAGQTTVFFWLLFSAMALNLYTGKRHEQEQGFWLDIQDSMIEADYFNQAKNGDNKNARKSYERMLKKALYATEQNPEVAKVIERRNPTLAEAMRAVQQDLANDPDPNPAMAA